MSALYISKERIKDFAEISIYKAIRYNGVNFEDIVQFAYDAIVSHRYVTPSLIKFSSENNVTSSTPLLEIGKECVIVTYNGETSVLTEGDYLVKGLNKLFDGSLILQDDYNEDDYVAYSNEEFLKSYITAGDFSNNLSLVMNALAHKLNDEYKGEQI